MFTRNVIPFSVFHPLTLRAGQVRKGWLGPKTGIPYLVEFTGKSLPSPLAAILFGVSSLKLTIAFQAVLFTLLRRYPIVVLASFTRLSSPAFRKLTYNCPVKPRYVIWLWVLDSAKLCYIPH